MTSFLSIDHVGDSFLTAPLQGHLPQMRSIIFTLLFLLHLSCPLLPFLPPLVPQSPSPSPRVPSLVPDPASTPLCAPHVTGTHHREPALAGVLSYSTVACVMRAQAEQLWSAVRGCPFAPGHQGFGFQSFIPRFLTSPFLNYPTHLLKSFCN